MWHGSGLSGQPLESSLLARPRNHRPTLSWLTAHRYKHGGAQSPTGKRVSCGSLGKPGRAVDCTDEACPEAEDCSLAGHRWGGGWFR